MWYHWLFFFFIAFGAKVLLAFAMIYLLLPADTECSQCGDTTLLIRANRIGRAGFALTRGRVQWRWCPVCRWEGLARRGSGPIERRPTRSGSARTPADRRT